MKPRQILWPALLVIAIAVALLAFASTRLSGNASDVRAGTRSAPVSPQTGSAIQYIRCAHLKTQVCDALKKLGNRLQVPGNERLTIAGSLTRTLPGGATEVATVRLISEFPNLVRLEEQRLGQVRVLAFDGQQAWTNLGLLTPPDLDLIQSLVFDNPDHFFLGQMKGTPTRFLGKGFRLNNTPNPNYSGPFYDLYQIDDEVKMGSQTRRQPKLVYLSTDKLRVERIGYQIQRATLSVKIQLLTPTWHMVNNQLVPNSIERIENGASIWKLTGSTWTFSPHADDGAFTRPTLP